MPYQKQITIHLNISDVEYILAKFDTGMPLPRIAIRLQYRVFLLSINVAILEQCPHNNEQLSKTPVANIIIKDENRVIKIQIWY